MLANMLRRKIFTSVRFAIVYRDYLHILQVIMYSNSHSHVSACNNNKKRILIIHTENRIVSININT